MTRIINRNVYLPSKCFEQLKQKARSLKKTNKIRHHEALELTAKETNLFSNWNEVAQSRKSSEILEESLTSGLILVYSHQDPIFSSWDDLYREKSTFEIDSSIKWILENYFYRAYCNSYDELETGELLTSTTLLEEYGEEECKILFEDEYSDYSFFRYKKTDLPKTARGVLGKISKYDVVDPCGFFLNGVYFMRDPYTNAYKEPPFFVLYLNSNYGTSFNMNEFRYPNFILRETKYSFPRFEIS